MMLKIDPLRPADYPEWAQLFQKYSVYRTMQADRLMMIEVWNQIFSNDSPLNALVARDASDHLVAFIHYQKIPLTFIKKHGDYLSEQFIDLQEKRAELSEALHLEVAKRLTKDIN